MLPHSITGACVGNDVSHAMRAAFRGGAARGLVRLHSLVPVCPESGGRHCATLRPSLTKALAHQHPLKTRQPQASTANCHWSHRLPSVYTKYLGCPRKKETAHAPILQG